MNLRQQQERENATFFTQQGLSKSKVNGSSGRAVDFGSFYAPLTIFNTLFSTSLTRDTKVVKAFALLSILSGFFWDLEIMYPTMNSLPRGLSC